MRFLKILLLIALLVLGSYPLISSEGSGESATRSEPIGSNNDLILSGPFGFDYWLYHSNAIVRHSNGNTYRFSGDDYSTDEADNEYDLALIVNEIDINGDESNYEAYELPSLSRELGYIQSVQEYFYEGDDGDIYGLVIVRTGPTYNSNYLDPDQYIMVHLDHEGNGNFDIDSWYLGEVDDIYERVKGLVNIQDEYFLTVHFNDTWHIIPFEVGNSFNDTCDIGDNSPYGISFDILDVDNELAIVKQDGLGEINITFLGPDLNITRSHTISVYPEGVGTDNMLHAMWIEDDIHIFSYRDIIYQDEIYGFRYLDHFAVSSSGVLLSSHKDLPIGDTSFLFDIEPIFFEDYFLIVDGTSEKVYQFDPAMVLVHTHDLMGETWILKAPASVEIMIFQNQSIMFGRSGWTDSAWGINILHPNEITEFGSLYLTSDNTIKGISNGMWAQIYIAEEASILIEDVVFQETETFLDYSSSIQNYGNLVLRNVSYQGDDPLKIQNYGTMILENVNFDTEFYGNGNITLIGSNNYLGGGARYSNGEYDIHSNITFLDVHQTTPEVVGTDISEVLSALNYDGEFNVIVENGNFLDQDDVIGRSVDSAYFVNCYFDQTEDWGEFSDLTFFNCVFNDVDSIMLSSYSNVLFDSCTFNSSDYLFAGSSHSLNIVDCIFNDITALGTYSGNRKFMNVTSSTFRSCSMIFQGDHIENLHVQDSTFENCNDVFLMFDNTNFRMNDNVLINCNRTIGVDLDEMDPLLFEVHDNRFQGGRIVAYMDQDPFHYEDLFEYGDPNDSLSDDHIHFFDISDNIWDTDDPANVASRLTFGFKFLPFKTMDGTEISTDDNDIDGMDDEWESENGLDPNYYYDRFMDGDMDGYSNYEEFKTGYDPFDVNSAPGANLMGERVIPWAIAGSVLLSILFVIFFPVNSIVRGIKIYRESKLQKSWMSAGPRPHPVNRRTPLILHSPGNEEVRHK